MSEDKDKNIGKEQIKEAKEATSRLDELVKINKQQSTVTQKMEDKASANLKISEALFKIQENPDLLLEDRAKGTESRLLEIKDLLSKTNNSEEVKKLLDESTSLFDQLVNVQEASNKKLETAISDNQTLNGLKLLNSKLSEQNDLVKADVTSFETAKALKNLEGFMGRNADETTRELRAGYEEATSDLKTAIKEDNAEAAEIARRQLEEIAKAAQTEEERREAVKLAELQSTALFQMGDKLEGLGEKMDGMGLAAKGGFLAGIAGLFLMFTDPEKFRAILKSVMGAIDGFFTAISLLLQGDVSGAMEAMKGHWGTFAAIVGSIGVLFLGKIVSLLGSAFKKMQMLVKAVQVFRVFMMTKFITPMIAGLQAMGASLGLAAGSMSAILAPALIIVAILGGLLWGFNKLRESLGPGASIMDTLKVAALYFIDFLAMIVNGLTFIPRKLIGFLGKRAAKWLLGEDFDTSALDAISEGLDTGRGARAAAEIREKNEKEALEAQMGEKEGNIQDIEGIPSDLSAEEIERVQGQQTDLKLDSQRDKPINNVNQIQTNTTKGGDNISTAVFHLPPSPAAYALGDLGGR